MAFLIASLMTSTLTEPRLASASAEDVKAPS